MESIKEQLVTLSEVDAQIALLQQQRKDLVDAIQSAVSIGEVIMGGPYVARWKPGRKSTNHEAAAHAANVPAHIVDKYRQIKESVQWAKVTKEAKVPRFILDEYTEEGEPSFVIEQAKA